MKKAIIASAMGVSLMLSGQAAMADAGKEVYDKACFACHMMGIAGAPKFADKDAWAPRIAKGLDVLKAHSIDGFTGEAGFMPPKGGRTDLSDDEVKAAVVYMVEQAQ
jgi:S-disulfanyl-L-cysteine oxidoreductase SoxD